MNKYSQFRALIVLLTLAVTQVIASAQVVTLPIASEANDLATSYYNGSNFRTGDQISGVELGNINTNPGQQLGLVKFDISSFFGQTASSVMLNLPVSFLVWENNAYATQTVGIYTFNYELSSAAFTSADAISTNVTFYTSLALTGTNYTASFDMTSAFTAAQVSGFDYFAIQLVNESVVSNPNLDYTYVRTTEALTLSVTPVPEPSTYVMFGLGLLMIVRLVKRSAAALADRN